MYFLSGLKNATNNGSCGNKKAGSPQRFKVFAYIDGYLTVTDTITGSKNPPFVAVLNRDNLFKKKRLEKRCANWSTIKVFIQSALSYS